MPSDTCRMAKKPSPFHFIKHLEGCHKGNKTKDVHRLKHYLHQFGYLDYPNQIHANNDDFDDLLESAVKNYQQNYHFKPTGTLDTETISKMVIPRCGNPDIVNGITFSRAQNNQTPDLVIGFHRLDHGDGSPFDGPGGTLAHGFPPTDGRFHYDSDESWSVAPVANTYHLESLALHEIGHLLGLGHSSLADAIMYPTFNSGQAKNLHADDIQGIRPLYNV